MENNRSSATSTTHTIQTSNPEVVNGIVVKCSERDWKVCCGCIYFGDEITECIFKERNRMGIIPNLVDDSKKIKDKFLTLLVAKK